MRSTRLVALVAVCGISILLGACFSNGMNDDLNGSGPGNDCTITVLPGESIQAAIDAAPAGAVICLAEGEWEENIAIAKNLTLRGVGAEQTILRGVDTGQVVIAIRTTEAAEAVVSVSNIAVRAAQRRDGPAGFLVEHSAHAIISDCTVSYSMNGIVLLDDARATITGFKVHETLMGIALTGTAQATIERCDISENAGPGINLSRSSRASISGSNVSENELGISLVGNAQLKIYDCSISGNAIGGIYLQEWTEVTIEASAVQRNGMAGIALIGLPKVTVADSVISENKGDGVVVSLSVELDIVNTHIKNNEAYGVALMERPCINTDAVFTGYVTGSSNTGGGNVDGDVCPDDLAFLFTEVGGELDRREEGK